MNGLLLLLMSAVRAEFRRLDPTCRIIIHAGYATSGHSDGSQHYQGNAADFHIETSIPYHVQIDRMLNILMRLQVADRVGLGIYPDWNNPGFHLDVRGRRARWGFIGSRQAGFEETIIYAEEKGL